MLRLPPGSTPTYTLFPYPTLFRSTGQTPVHLVARRARRPLVRPAAAALGLECGVKSFYTMIGETPNERRYSPLRVAVARRSEEHTSELQSLMRISYAVFCLKKKKNKK